MLFSFVAILGRLNGPSSPNVAGRPSAESIGAADFSLNKIRVLVGIAAAVAITGTCNRSEGHGCGAHVGVGLHRRAYLVNFIDRQLTSAFPYKHSVVFLSRHSFSPFSFFLHSLAPDPHITDKTYLRPSRPWAGV
jgi:hypothetical protein